jgi:ketosteroid isomerase-like protein
MRAVMVSLMLLTATSMTGQTRTNEADETAVREAANRFYAALNRMFTGDLTPMRETWSHADDVTYMGPDGSFDVGWEAVLANWEKQAAMKLGGRVEPDGMRVIVGENLAVTHNLEKGQNVGADGKPLTVSIRATNVFRKENGQWKMIGHHTDLLPFLEG